MDSRDEQIEHLKLYIQSQNEQLAKKDAAIADLRKLVEDLQTLKANLEETLNEFRRQFFGIRSEKTRKDIPPENQPASPKVEVKAHTRKRKPKAKRDDIYAGLPVREVKIPLSQESSRCSYCNAQMMPIGYTEVREKIRITPSKVERIETAGP